MPNKDSDEVKVVCGELVLVLTRGEVDKVVKTLRGQPVVYVTAETWAKFQK